MWLQRLKMDKRQRPEELERIRLEQEKAEKQELTFGHILWVKIQMEEARKKVYAENLVGQQGITISLVMGSLLLSTLSRTNRMLKTFPRIAVLKGAFPIIPEICLVTMCLYGGQEIEQYRIAHTFRPNEFKEYMQLMTYYESLKQRRVEQLSWMQRVYLLLGVKQT